MSDTKQTRIPTPLYAAAGASDLAYQQLRKLPAKVAQLRGRATELRPAVTDVVTDLTTRTELDRLRTAARRNATAFVTSAQSAQERAGAVYTDLVNRGELVVRGARTGAAEDLKATADVVVDAAAEIETAATAVAPQDTTQPATTPSAAVATGSSATVTTAPDSATTSESGTAEVTTTPKGRRNVARKSTRPAAE